MSNKSKIYYAIEIFSKSTDSWYTTTNTTYGLVSGVFRFVTGRPGYKGTVTPKYSAYEINRSGTSIGNNNVTSYFYDGFLLQDGLKSPERSVDITSGGAYGSISSYSFSIRNDISFFEYLSDTSIELTGRDVVVWVVIDNVFYQCARGIITGNSYDEISYNFEVSDDSTFRHKQIPPNTVTVTKEDSEDVDDEVIPVVFGDVPYSKVVSTESGGLESPLVSIANKNDICASVSYTVTTSGGLVTGCKIGLLNENQYFAANHFAGKYIKVISGSNAATISYRIVSSDVTDSLDRITYVYLDSVLQLSNGTAVNASTYNSSYIYNFNYTTHMPVSGSKNVWYFSIYDNKVDIASSNGTITPVVNEFGKYSSYNYDSNTNKYVDISRIVDVNSSATQITLVSPLASSDGKVTIYDDIGLNLRYFGLSNSRNPFANGSYSTVVGPSGGWDNYREGGEVITPDYSATPLTTVRDRSRLTNYQIPIGYPTLGEDLYFFTGWTLAKIKDIPSKICLLFDFKYQNSDVAAPASSIQIGDMYYALYDSYFKRFFGTAGGNLVNYNFPLTVDLTDYTCNLLPNFYYKSSNITGDTTSFYSYPDGSNNLVQAYFDITTGSGVLADITNNQIATTLEASCRIHSTEYFSDFLMKLKNISLLGIYEVDAITGDIYLKLSGEKTGSGATEASADTNNVYTTFVHILEDYDGINKNLINYSSMFTKRNTWHVGRTVNDRSSSIDYLTELCAQSFTTLFNTRQGKICVKPFDDFLSPGPAYITHDSDIIIEGSITSYEKTSSSQIYNNFLLNYNYNQGLGEFDRKLVVNKVDTSSSFPAEATTDSFGNPLWWSYVGGLQDPNTSYYTQAKDIWDRCRASYLLNGNLQLNQSDTSELNWYADRKIFDSTTSWGTTITSSAYYLLDLMSQWTTKQKYVVSYSVPITTDTIQLELMDSLYFNDTFYTGGVDKYGRIISIEVDMENDSINLKVMLYP